VDALSLRLSHITVFTYEILSIDDRPCLTCILIRSLIILYSICTAITVDIAIRDRWDVDLDDGGRFGADKYLKDDNTASAPDGHSELEVMLMLGEDDSLRLLCWG
jgi:hypothetical protein